MTEHKKYGPQTELAENMDATKYRLPGESFRDKCSRVAGGLKDSDEHFHAYRGILLDQRFLPGGRVQSSIGTGKGVTAYNCFVSGSIEDSFVTGEGSIMARATDAAATMRLGGGIGYDFSTLRPRGDLINKLQSSSTGPIAFMHIFDAICKATSSSGHRRGAQMGVLRVDHPDIQEFITAKQNKDQLTGFNISVGITDEFMQCLQKKKPFALRFGGKVYREVDPGVLWEQIMRSTWDWAEPGVLFIDAINRMNNLWYCETIAATNPCGEQPLPPYGACLLGSFNLTKYIKQDLTGWNFDFDQYRADIPHVVRAMDNVVDRTIYPLPEQEAEAKAKRRMGLGVTGLANAAEALGFPYGSESFLGFQNLVLSVLRTEAYSASADLAAEKGAFPLFDREKYLQSEFIRDLPDWLQEKIARLGIRNSHLTSIAPTGTISMTADNVSSGIEPVFSHESYRIIQRWDGPEQVVLKDYAMQEWGVYGKPSADVTVQEHLAVLSAAQRYMDSAVSKTCNVGDDCTWEEFKDVYIQAWRMGCKGITTYRASGLRGAVLVAKPTEKEAQSSCEFDPATGRKNCE